MNKSYYNTPKQGRIMQMLWAAAGADKYILDRSTYSDHIKYACLGGIVVATGLMAGLAGGYAMYTIFAPKGSALDTTVHWPTILLAIVFGCIWGGIIFNLDRFIVASTGKGDGTEAITSQEFKSALPRLFMGAIIAITISKPMEIRMFETEINVELHKVQMSKKAEYLAGIDANFNGRIEAEKEKIKKWDQEITEKQAEFRTLEGRYLNEIQDPSRPGEGKIAISIKGQMARAEADLKNIQAKNDPLKDKSYAQLKIWEKEKQAAIKEGDNIANGLDGLLQRIKIAHEIAGIWVSLFITLLFMAIELTPVFFKLMLIKGPYDFLEENIKELIKAEQGIEIQYEYYKDKQGQERNLVINHQAEQVLAEKVKLIKAQQKLNEHIVDVWMQRELKRIKENPELYITTEEPPAISLN